jgi:UDPglucose--hexose-1-phosphate uridylyltransferase
MELRKDYILERYVIVSEIRGLRPNNFRKDVNPENISDDKIACFFCPGNEYLTTPEKGKIGTPWSIRWFDNKFPALEPIGKYYIQTDNKYFTFSDAYGYTEVIVETNDHSKQLSDFTDAELRDVLRVYIARIKELSSKEHIKYVFVFKNCGRDAGTSVKHTHTQVMALNHVPKDIIEKLDVLKRYAYCPYCEILNIERASARRCFENEHFVAFTPYASRFNYEIWIFPKKHYLSITQLNDIELLALAGIMKPILSRLKDLGCAYNYYIHNSPEEYVPDSVSDNLSNNVPNGMHFHLEIIPRINIYAGLELGSGTIINNIPPENAARFYRREI